MTALSLNAVEYGSGPPLAILHGLFGSGRNWAAIAQRLAERRRVIALDLRNHGASPWADSMNYAEMAHDVRHTLHVLGHRRFALLGHSMGGKVAMIAALLHGDEIERLVVADIAPVAYPPRHLGHVRAMHALDLAGLSRRSEADARLAAAVPDPAERAFLLQNLAFDPLPSPPPLYPHPNPPPLDPHLNPPPLAGEGREGVSAEARVGVAGAPRWRLNLAAIEREMTMLVGFPLFPADAVYDGPALFVAGGRSDYLRPEHEPEIRRLFPNARIERIADAGHWLHAERPKEFLDLVEPFLHAALP
jgi:esterase